MRLELGGGVRCSDGAVRELGDIVLDAPDRRVTHLVVQPSGHHEAARLVAIELAGESPGGGSEISLSCSSEALDRLDSVREFAYLRPGQRPEQGGDWGVGVEDVLVAPSYAPPDVVEPDFFGSDVSLMYDRVPRGEVELRRTSLVYSADKHHVGTVDGVVLDADARISQLLLRRGHLWWRREIRVPKEAVATLETDTVTLGASKNELKRFPSGRARRGG